MLRWTGPLAEAPVDLHNAWMRVGDDGGDPDWPNLQILFLSLLFGADFGTFNAAAANLDAWVGEQSSLRTEAAEGGGRVEPMLLFFRSNIWWSIISSEILSFSYINSLSIYYNNNIVDRLL